MEVDYLLEDNDRFKLLIIQYLDLEKNNYVHLSKLYELTCLTKFKLDKLFVELSEDMLDFPEEPKISIDSSGIIETQHLNLNVVKKLKLRYLEQSMTFKLLEDIIINQSSIDTFSEKNHLSTSQVYVKRKKLNSFLKKLNLKLKKNSLVGDEIMVRNRLFSIYYDIYGGIKFPLPNEILLVTKELIRQYEHWFNLKMTVNERVKLQLLIGITLCRMNNGFFIKTSFASSGGELEGFFQIQANLLAENFRKNTGVFLNDLDYIFLYTCLNIDGHYPDGRLDKEKVDFFKNADFFSKKSCQQIASALPIADTVSSETARTIFHEFEEKVRRSNRNRALFDFEIMSFRSERSVSFFSETYPYITRIIKETLKENVEKYAINGNSTQVQLFFDYIFILFSVCPVELLEAPIYVCVDFTRGKNYNEFIRKQIEGFKHFNIHIVDRITQDTNIYISDCLIEELPLQQIIWKSPPSSDDWEDFGNCVVEVKKNRSN